MKSARIVVIGAGIGGLVAATLLAARGRDVLLLERQATPGGKMRLVRAGDALIDGGPTVFTMRSLFERIFAEAGTSLDAELTLKPLSVLARHSWGHGPELDLFASLEESVDAIGAFAGRDEAARFRAMQAEARHMFETLNKTFIEAQRPSPFDVAFGGGVTGLLNMMKINPFETLWGAVSRHLKDPRLRQLFGRYATYVGSSPFSAVATLLLIAHVEQEGVWSIKGGMHAVARAFEHLFQKHGGTCRYNTNVERIETGQSGVTAVITAEGERIACSDVIVNADVNALASGLFGQDVASAFDPVPRKARSLSAITWCAHLKTAGFPLALHSVFFSRDYRHEFDELRKGYPSDPTVYICAQDRVSQDHHAQDQIAFHGGKERLLILINSPANGDRDEKNRNQIERAMRRKLSACGLSLVWDDASVTTTSPQGFEALFPATGGALYATAERSQINPGRSLGEVRSLSGTSSLE